MSLQVWRQFGQHWSNFQHTGWDPPRVPPSAGRDNTVITVITPSVSLVLTTSSITTNIFTDTFNSPIRGKWYCMQTMHSDNCSSSVAPAQKVKKLEWNDNLQPTRHPKICDYVPEVYHLIMLAIHEFLACVCILDALPDPETQATWANVVWENSWKSVDKEYGLTDRVVSLVHF